ncbi:hypothetical protein K491DRAFT_677596 [Lophiostoma macrostomum CBS 122681]|uniref:Uncharacterized protein n=1 Tax=Lophiostoma macrostomum CBS 122681 TaxID=1314788 RepID=A0A6A6TAF1_9PLEO|nr:hypothetical protein K491DRAFT_677596 [Lophiostoma macrostomum CBS 122681]
MRFLPSHFLASRTSSNSDSSATTPLLQPSQSALNHSSRGSSRTGSHSTSTASSTPSSRMPFPLLPHEDLCLTDAGYSCSTTLTEPFPVFDVVNPANPSFVPIEPLHCERHCKTRICAYGREYKSYFGIPLDDCTCPVYSPAIEEDPRHSGPLPQIVSIPNSLIEEAHKIAKDFSPASDMTIHYCDALKLLDALRRTHKPYVRSVSLHKGVWSMFWKTLEAYLEKSLKVQGQRTESLKQIRLEMEGCLQIGLVEIAYEYAREELSETVGQPGTRTPVYVSRPWGQDLEELGREDGRVAGSVSLALDGRREEEEARVNFMHHDPSNIIPLNSSLFSIISVSDSISLSLALIRMSSQLDINDILAAVADRFAIKLSATPHAPIHFQGASGTHYMLHEFMQSDCRPGFGLVLKTQGPDFDPLNIPHPITNQLPTAHEFVALLLAAQAQGVLAAESTTFGNIFSILYYLYMEAMTKDPAPAPSMFFGSMRAFELWLQLPSPPASFPAPSAEIFAHYLEHFAPALLNTNDDRFEGGIALLIRRFHDLLHVRKTLSVDGFVGFFWFFRCFTLWWKEGNKDNDDKGGQQAVKGTYVDKARDPRRKNGGKDQTILRTDSPVNGNCGADGHDDLYEGPPRKQESKPRKRRGQRRPGSNRLILGDTGDRNRWWFDDMTPRNPWS